MQNTGFRSFKDGFNTQMEEDFILSLYERDLPDVEFKAPNLDAFLETVFEESKPIFDAERNNQGFISARAYACLGADLYMALVYDPSYTAYEGSEIIDKYRLDLYFDYATGEDHDIGVYQLG